MGFCKKLRLCGVILGLCFFYLPITHAVADGPDFFQSKEGVLKMEVYEEADSKSKHIHTLDAPISGMRNQGCKSAPTFKAWSKLTGQQKEQAPFRIWCKISYQDISGWVQNHYLSEDDKSAQPSFDCHKTKVRVEKIICQYQSLIKLDNVLQAVFEEARHKAASSSDDSKKEVKQLKAIQRGWIKGRNECWKAQTNIVECIESSYLERIAYLQAQWALISPIKTEQYACGKNQPEFSVAFIPTEPMASVVVEYADKRQVFLQSNKQDKKMFQGELGRSIKLNEGVATLVWDQSQPGFTCKLSNGQRG